jgi:hypothetical protein
MHERFGDAFDAVEMRRKGQGSHFMISWERVKRDFGTSNDAQMYEIGPLVLKGDHRSSHYDEEEGMVYLTKCVPSSQDASRY